MLWLGMWYSLTPVISSCYSELKGEAIHASSFLQCTSVYLLWLQSISLTMHFCKIQWDLYYISCFINGNARLPSPPSCFWHWRFASSWRGTSALVSCLQTAGLLQYFALSIWCLSVLCLPVNDDDLNFPPVFQFLINTLSFMNILIEKNSLITVSFADIVSLEKLL